MSCHVLLQAILPIQGSNLGLVNYRQILYSLSHQRSPEMSQGTSKYGTSLVLQMVKNLAAMWETQVPSLGQEDPLEKEMATHLHKIHSVGNC